MFRANHLSMGLLHNKLKVFLDLEQGNHSIFDYTRQFNTLAQYGSYNIDTDEKKANLYRERLTIQLQDRLIQSPNLFYNELVSAAINQERIMKAIAEAKEKKRMMPGSFVSNGSSSAPPKYRMVYTSTAAVLGQPPIIPVAAVLAATIVAAAVQPFSYPTATANYSQATTASSHPQLSMLQLREVGTLHPRVPHAQAKQLTTSSSTRGQSTEGPTEGSWTMDWPHQLHHRG
jgi:hypothetical protein